MRLEYRTAAELAENPANWRRHPPAQLKPLRAVLAEVGWAGALLYNEQTGRLIDGHARKAIAGKTGRVPVLVGSWSEADERKILATLDPLGALAETDSDAVTKLLSQVTTASTALREMLANSVPAPDFDCPAAPDGVQANVDRLATIAQRRRGNAAKSEKDDTERFLILVFPNRQAKTERLRALGLPEDERYLPAAGYDLRRRPESQNGRFASAPRSASMRKAGATG